MQILLVKYVGFHGRRRVYRAACETRTLQFQLDFE